MSTLKPFSEDITTGGNILSEFSPESYAGPEDVTFKHLQQGKDLDVKVKIYLSLAGITGGPRQRWIKDALKLDWKDSEHLGFDKGLGSQKYNQELLDFLKFHDKECLLSEVLKNTGPVPKSLQKHLKAQISDLVEKPVKTRGREGIALTKREQDKIYASPGVVPTWWYPYPKKGTYTYHAIRAIKRTGASARDVKLAVEKATTGKWLNVQENNIIVEGWGISGVKKIREGEYTVNEKLFRLYQGDMYYHRDVGWY